jgi:hypothetical protein
MNASESDISSELASITIWRDKARTLEKWFRYEVVLDDEIVGRLPDSGFERFCISAQQEYSLTILRRKTKLAERRVQLDSRPAEFVCGNYTKSLGSCDLTIVNEHHPRPTYLINTSSISGSDPIGLDHAKTRAMVGIIFFFLVFLGFIALGLVLLLGSGSNSSGVTTVAGAIAVATALVPLRFAAVGAHYLRAQWNYPLVQVG